MEITWYGYSCFRITGRGQTSVLTDPWHPQQDLAPLRARADLLTFSHNGAAQPLGPSREGQYIIASAGEYEVGELFVTGIPLHRYDADQAQLLENVAYHFEYANNLKVLHLGALRQAPTQDSLEDLDEVHALLLPVGGGLSGDALADLISMIEPRYVLPMQTAGATADYAAALDNFLKAMGLANIEAQASLRLTASTLPEQTQVALLRATDLPN